MASLEKLSKALEALKHVLSSTQPTEDTTTRSKEKISLCITIADMLSLPETKSASNFSLLLAHSMETLFLMCDDNDSNIRMVADECLNRVIRSLMDGHVAKVNLELHNEIKKNRNARSLRSALMKFAELANTIRPIKRKVFMQNMVHCIKNISKRQEESVLETLASSLGKFLVPLGCFLTDSEVKDLLQVFMKNIASENAVFRRTAAQSILAICLNCSKPHLFLVHTINSLLESVIPVKEDQSTYTILGVLNCVRGLLGHLECQSTDTGLRGSFGLKRKQKKDAVLSVDSLIQVFELCLHWTSHQDHNVITAALETLNELLTSPPPLLVPILLNQHGLSRSRIFPGNVGWKLNIKTLSDISVATTVPHSEDLSFLESDEPSPLLPNLSGWLDSGSITGSQTNIPSTFEKTGDKSGPASVNQDSLHDYPDSESVMSEDFGSALAKTPASQTPEHDLSYSRDSPSPPLDSFHPMPWDIGEVTDGTQSPLLYTGRKLVTAFLVPECGNVRVSVRSLAITCLSQVVRLSPNIFFQPVDKHGLSTPKGFSHICDIMCFTTHSDQQLRGIIRLLIGNLIHSLFSQVNYGPQFFEEHPEKNITLEEFVNVLITGILDESSVCVRHSLSALTLCLPDIMDSNQYKLSSLILDKLLAITRNPYWLVKVKLVELICSLPYQCVYFIKGDSNFQSAVINLITHEFLGNEDNRVRKTTCEGIVKIIKNLHFPIDYGVDDVVVARGISLSSNMFFDTFRKGSDRTCRNPEIENTLSRVVDILVETLMLSSSRHLSFGCIEALCKLSEVYPPSMYSLSWQCYNDQNQSSSVDGGLFCIVVTLLTKSPVSLDLECHQWLLKLASHLFTGLQTFLSEKKEINENNEKSQLDLAVNELLTHVMRLMYIFVRVMEDGTPSKSLLSSPLKKRTTPRSSSPSKNQSVPEKEPEKEVKTRHIGPFGNDPHCCKLLETARSGYTNYKLTLDSQASGKFLSLLRHTLGCFEAMLSPNNAIDSSSIFEELLLYLRVTFVLDSEYTVKVVFQLLRSLFETNLLGVKITSTTEKLTATEKSYLNGFFVNIFMNPLMKLTQQCDSSQHETQQTERDRIEEKEKKPLTQSEREILASRIKLFETIVIQSLKEYTLTCNVRLQAQVLRLLTLLVQLKVNYCLLDSDFIFIDFVLKQFEFLEAGQISDAEVLIPSIFNFLVHLSNEKNHSKPVISMPKIIQLCDGLMASGQNPVTHSIPALIPVVENVFYRSSNAVDQKEVETQKEVLLAMLLRLAEYPQVLEMLYNLLSDGWKWEENWARWYKQTVDSISPLLAEGRLLVTDLSVLHCIFCLNKRLSAPISNILMLLFSPQQEGQTHSQWLGMVNVMLLSVSMYAEDAVLIDLEQLNLYVREEGDDPLKVKPVSKTLPPQSLLAKLLFRIISTSVSKLASLIESPYKEEDVYDFEKAFSRFLLCCILILQPGRFTKVGKSLQSLIKDNADLSSLEESFKTIGQCCQIPVLLWTQIMSIVDHEFQKCTFYMFPKKLSLNQELIRRGIIMLYAEYLERKPQDLESLEWFLSGYIEDIIWHCQEPPIEKLLASIYNLVPNSKLLLESCSKCISIKEPVFTHRLLHTLEYIHSNFSGAVLKLVALSLIKYTNIAIARLAAAFCCRTIEFILTSENPVVKKQLTEDELCYIFSRLSLNQRQFKRHNGLIILLNKLGKQNYNISLCEFDDCVKPVSSDSIRSTRLDKSWFISLVKEKCSKGSDCDRRKCAYLLNKLEYNDIENIMNASDFDVKILEHCFSIEMDSSLKESSNQTTDSSELSVYKCAQKSLFLKIRETYKGLPKVYEVFNPNDSTNHDLFQYFSSNDSIENLLSLIPALKNYLISLENGCNEIACSESDCIALSRFGVLCVEAISWFVFQMPRHEVQHWPSVVQSILECSAAVFRINCLSSLLTFEQITSICIALSSLFKFITGEAVAMKTFKAPGLAESDLVMTTSLQMISILSWMEESSDSIPNFIFESSKSIIIALGRNSKLNWLCRIPMEAWQFPLDSHSPPTIPMHLLHDAEILNQIVSRIHLLGWKGKAQFEESWVCMLGALSPNPDIDNVDQEEISAIMHVTQKYVEKCRESMPDDVLIKRWGDIAARKCWEGCEKQTKITYCFKIKLIDANSLAIDGITWLVISTLSYKSNSMNEPTYIHVPRHSNEQLSTLKYWDRLAAMNDILLQKLKRICGENGTKLLRIDQRPNLERADNIHRYGFGQLSVAYLQAQIKSPEDSDESNKTDTEASDLGKANILSSNGIDTRSCVQFILDLFSQWALPDSGISINLQLSMIKSILCISDLFSEKSHFEWMLNTFLDLIKIHSSDDEIMHQYLVIGIAKSCAVLNCFSDERGDKTLKIILAALNNPFRPLQQAGIHGLLYLLQATRNIEKSAEDGESAKSKPQDFLLKVLHYSSELISRFFQSETPQINNDSLLTLALIFYLLEYYAAEIADPLNLLKELMDLVKSCGNGLAYRAILQGFERLVLFGNYNFNDQMTRLALDRFSQSDPNITIPALQLLLTCIYADTKNNEERNKEESEPWTIEIMEKVTALFDRIKKGYPIEVEIVCDILPGILSDFFSASDILTKVIGEFLSPNQPHKRNMAAMVFQVFTQACSEQQLPLLQDWVVYSLNNLTHNLPLMMAGWSLCCFFISASTNPWLKAIFPLVQSRIRQCEYEDRQILCLAAVDFYSQLTSKQKEIFMKSLESTSSSQTSPFVDIIKCL